GLGIGPNPQSPIPNPQLIILLYSISSIFFNLLYSFNIDLFILNIIIFYFYLMSIGVFSQQKDLRVRLQETLQKYNIKQVDVARGKNNLIFIILDTNIHHSTLSQWLQGKAKCSTYKLEESIENWLNNFYSNKPKYAGTNYSRMELLKNKRERDKNDLFDNKNHLYEPFDNNHNFDNLIPINLNVELEGKKYKEIFFWNLNEPYLPVKNFAKILCEDNNLPNGFETEIINQMEKQISLYKHYEKIDGEILKVIKLDIRIGDMVYQDQIEWDINNPDNSPEEFAKTVCIDLGLGTEFVLPICHSIREQILEFQKSVVTEKKNSYYNGYYIKPNALSKNKVDENNYLRDIFTESSEWQPTVKKITQEEIKRFEKNEERKARYAQRRK
ncbi:MAG: SWI/SNF chromatin-remodeling complex subunit SNF5, partial [archaeon]|nr:SWI/SNF chromatin-remodeling complex subunit SNF5 [archaeon]